MVELAAAAHPLQVRPGAQVLAGAVEHQGAQPRVLGEGLQLLVQGPEQGLVEGVAGMRTVQGQAGDRRLRPAQQHVAHGRQLAIFRDRAVLSY
ncbi:hypothetical protein N5I14_22670 [Pseudomonas mosselii]|uniref:Uncharacterized protein n=1 Tax=Pseudomonas mosselii TaxID=78327 RepID=A0AA42S2T9_9PSED|nr:hypothetical protein [Pseudomonas mosselii]MDH1633050.1 hypothetical protein [Pseudomonas mosselii]